MSTSTADRAVPDPVSDQTLEVMIDLAREGYYGRTTVEGGHLLRQNLAPCLEELLDYRRRAAASLELEPDAVQPTPPVIRLFPDDTGS